MAESLNNFLRRIETHAGMPACRIPTMTWEQAHDCYGMSIICSSPHGTLVLVDHDYQDDTGIDYYERCALVNRSPNLPSPDEDATGRFEDEGVE